MEHSETSASYGPVIFFGLTAYVLATSSPVAPEFRNPAEMMDLDAVARGAELQASALPAAEPPPPGRRGTPPR
ncbi:MAG: hypothetical protein EP318_06970, partial [Rhodobacteraceae bacterium]